MNSKERQLISLLRRGKTQKQIAEFTGLKKGQVDYFIQRKNLRGFKARLNKPKFSFSDPYFCYFLGLYLTDGYFSSSTKRVDISLQSKDRKILYLLKDKLQAGKTCFVNKNTVIKWYLNTEESKYFQKITLLTSGAKTYNAKVPFMVPKALEKFVIRGMIDGDGTIRKSSNRETRFYSESPYLLKFFENFLQRKGYQYSFQDNGKVLYIKDSFLFLLEVYQDIPELSIQRKRKLIETKVYDIVRTYEMINHKKWFN